jgi:predicted AAA+ superfamily ATPase
LRNELKLSKKVYFYDTGIRNAIINNFQIADTRQDIGALFENYLIAERLKYNEYNKRYVNRFFWRTKEQQEIDYIEEYNGNLYAFEFKWNAAKKATFSKTFTNAYPSTQTMVITKDNYEVFLKQDS